ncbi:MAG: Ig-like domain-containing protein [Propionicimonas sp.]
MLKSLTGNARKAISTVVVVAVTAGIATAASLYQGYPTADVQLNDGGVWVTRSIDAMVGHLNYPSRTLDGAVRTHGSDFTLFQDGNDVLIYDQAVGSLTQVDPATVDFGGAGNLTAGSRLAFHSGVIGLIDAGTNGLYVMKPAAVSGFSVVGRDPIQELGPGSAVAVAVSGTVFAVSLEKNTLVSVKGEFGEPSMRTLDKFGAKAQLSISAVGDTPVILDATNGVLYTGDRTIPLPEAKGGVLQTAGAASDRVLIGTAAGLVEQPLDGGNDTIMPTPAGGVPSQPVWLNGCAYAVWSGTGAYVRDCAGETDDRNEVIEKAGTQPKLTLRQNRNVVVVNELGQGLIWLIEQDMFQVQNWDDVTPKGNDGQEQTEDTKLQFTLPKRLPENTRPVAKSDDFGVRAGETAVLPVLDNDTDADGDLLAASLVGEAPDVLKVQPVSSGAALQVTANRNATGTLTFRYQVDDGRDNGTAEAQVTLKVTPAGQNAAPHQGRVHTMQLEVGATATYEGLMEWLDPDGDDFYLKKAWSDIGDGVAYRNNGVIQFTEAAGERGIHEIHLLVTDGQSEQQGLLRVDVRAKGTLPPVANADRYGAIVGEPITVSPLANDLSASGKQLRLAKLDPLTDVKLLPDYTAGTFSFEAAKPGTYYVQYLVTDGPTAADGIVRIDVLAAGVAGVAPLATRDTALLQPSREALVDVLANDSDPTGGILVVQGVTVPKGSKVSAQVLEHRVLRVKDTGGLTTPVTINYRVSNGSAWADGEVRVIPVPAAESKAPVALNDRAVVRAGDIVTVDVTANDYHPGGDTVELLPELKETPDPADGVAFVSEGKVRFKAGPNENSVSLVYEVTDSQMHVSSAYLRIQIVAPEDGDNAAPLPRSVTARAISGTTVRVPIPLDGIDPDGDWVELLGTATAAKKGRVSVGDSWLVYQANPGAVGRDSFEYVVRDRLGASAKGTVVVGIAAPSNQNRAPYTVRDQVQVRPGRNVSVPVLQNDSDPDGDDIALVPKGLGVPDGLSAQVVKSRVVVTAPTAEGDYSLTYTAVDPYGAKAQGNLVVTVSPDSLLKAPIARDDRVQPIQLGSQKTVDVAVLENDEDPDGVAEDLKVTTDDPNTVVRTDGGLTVTLAKTPQLILYTITDVDAQSTSAAVFVPGTDSLLPTLKLTQPLEVLAGKELRIALADAVLVRTGHKPRVSEGDSVRAGHSAGKSLVVDEATLAYTADADYFGPDALSVKVTDGEGPDDPKGNSAYLSIPILVLPATNQPPTFLNTAVEVAPDEDAADLNWRKLTSDPDPADATKLTFRTTSVPRGFSAQVEGDHLRISADSTVAQGTQAEIEVEVTDHTTAPTVGKVAVSVTSSERPLPVALDDVIPSADQGQPVAVDVLSNDTPNPFPDTPLTIVSTKVIKGNGDARIDGSRVVVTPAADFVGTMQVTYRVQDATKSPEREAEATISVTVQGRPDQPSRPIVVTVGDRTVVLQWTPPGNNGRPITAYTVSSKVKNFSQKCGSTTCTLKGLTNDVEYTFSVVATNDVGDSDPSPASAIARPDTRPDTPAPPKLVFGDKSLDVTWKTPHTSGSAVLSFNLEISPAPESGPIQLTGITGNSYTWKGLKNGTSYQVRVQAVNRAPDPSDFSQYSGAEVPAGPPSAPSRPTTDPATPVGSQAQISVSWPAVTGDAANGDAVKEYSLKVIHGGSTRTITTAGTSQNVTVDPSTSDYTFQVVATNKAGNSTPSPASVPRRAAVAPAAPQNVSADPGDGKVTLTFSAGGLNGSTAGEITWHYEVNQTGANGTIRSGGSIGGLNNGTKYTVDVWGTSSVAGVSPGKKATSNQAIPFGKPVITLQAINRMDNAVEFRWHVDSNGASLTAQTPNVDGSGNGSVTRTGLAAGEYTTLDVSYTNKAGTATDRWTGQANDPPPPPSVSVYRGTYQGDCPVMGPGPCYTIGVQTANFPGNVTCRLDGSYATTYGPNDRKIIPGPWRGNNIVFTVNCNGVTWSGKMPP